MSSSGHHRVGAYIAHRPKNQPAEAASPRGETILFVDDEPSVRECASDSLQAEGYAVVTVPDGAEALAYYRSHPGEVGLVILDVCMPGLNGEETFDRLRQMDPAVRTILISGYSPEGVVSRCLDHGALAFLRKPFQLEELTAVVRESLQAAAGND
jgi:CheY-like chemotaxis protein